MCETMNKRELGKTGIEMTELGYGCTAQFLQNKNVTAASFNTLDPEHLKDNVQALNMELPEEIVEKIESVI